MTKMCPDTQVMVRLRLKSTFFFSLLTIFKSTNGLFSPTPLTKKNVDFTLKRQKHNNYQNVPPNLTPWQLCDTKKYYHTNKCIWSGDPMPSQVANDVGHANHIYFSIITAPESHLFSKA